MNEKSAKKAKASMQSNASKASFYEQQSQHLVEQILIDNQDDQVKDIDVQNDVGGSNSSKSLEEQIIQKQKLSPTKKEVLSSFHSVNLQEEKEAQQQKPKHKYSNTSIEEKANFLSVIFFYWTGYIMEYAQKNYLEVEDLFQCRTDESFAWVKKEYMPHFTDKRRKTKSVIGSMWHIMKWSLTISLILMIAGNLCQFSGPYLMQRILEYLDGTNGISTIWAYAYALIIFATYFIRAIIMQHGFHFLNRCSYRTISASEISIFSKLMNLSSAAKSQLDAGKVVNLASIDAMTIFNFLMFGSFLITSPIMMLVSLGFIINEVGYAGLVGFGIMIISQFVNGWLSSKMQFIRKDIQYYQDERGKIISEIVSGIRIIKYMGLERHVQNKIQNVRTPEVKALLLDNIFRSLLEIFTITVPILIILGTFGTYIALGNELTPAKALSTLGFFNLMAIPMRMFGFTLFSLANVIVSVKRLSSFSNWQEKREEDNEADNDYPVGQLEISNGEFCWQTIEAIQDLAKFKQLGDKGKKQDDKSKESSKAQITTKKEDNQQQQKQGDKLQIDNLNSESQLKEPLLGSAQNQSSQSIQAQSNKDLVILKDINVRVKAGEFVCIIGKVGSGKSSLVQALIGEMHKEAGLLKFKGKIAFATQQAWLMNASVMQNILFYHDYDQKKYEHVLKICQLEDDIRILTNGDQTEIGEKGVNLSGGQKQRVALARAVYSNADIFIVDDCLSALDSYVGRKIFDNVLKGELKGKTIIFITHAIHFVTEADRVLVMLDGRIAEQGTSTELQVNPNSEFNRLAMSLRRQEADEEEKKEQLAQQLKKQKEIEVDKALIGTDSIQKQAAQTQPAQNQKIDSSENNTKDNKSQAAANISKGQTGQQLEAKQSGNVKGAIYLKYFQQGGLCLAISIFVLYIFSQTALVGNNLWIGYWSDQEFKISQKMYMLIYAGISLVIIILTLFRGLGFAYFSKNAALNLQKKLIYSVLRSPMTWFDITPSGRILNRTNKDQSDIDITLPWSMQLTMSNVFSILGFFIVTGVILPYFFAFVAVAIYIYWILCVKYLKAIRELKRIQAFSRAPALSIFSECYHGNQIIRSYQKQDVIMQQLEKRMNIFITSTSNLFSMSRWISLRTDFFIAFSVGCTVLLAVFAKDNNYVGSPGIIGVAITSVLQVTGLISFTIKVFSDTELGMSAVERLYEYIDKKDVEPDWDKPTPQEILAQQQPNQLAESQEKDNSPLIQTKQNQELDIGQQNAKNEQVEKKKTSKKQLIWPNSGQFSIQNVTFRYRPELPDVIHGISLDIAPHEKIGVVGRTGSGKSTLTLALLRILEVYANSLDQQVGKIILDGIDIKDVGLHHLRKSVTIIPQDPILFSGTIKSNMDPFNQFSDDQIIESLKKTTMFDHLKEPEKFINSEMKNRLGQNKAKLAEQEKMWLTLSQEQKKLYMPVSDGGQNFSLGQRQLLCISRALILRNKILLMDEATASIDEATDHLIQKMIKTEFQDTTVITIAHRINTIIQYDKILVLDYGKVVEFESPAQLLQDESGYFTKLVNEHGVKFAEKMKYLASNKHAESY